MLFLLVIVAANVSYIWLRKEPQFRERAAPTRELINVLNSGVVRTSSGHPIHVCGFPLHPWIGATTVAGFTSLNQSDVIFPDACNPAQDQMALRWDEGRKKYTSVP
jgi:hypothetical protein